MQKNFKRTDLVTAMLVAVMAVSTAGNLPAQNRAEREAWKSIADLGDGKGFVVWESNREGGNWRIWHRRLDGRDKRRLTPDEKGRDHACPAVAPDGRRIVYMSYPKGRNYNIGSDGPETELYIINIDGKGNRMLVPNSHRVVGGNRAVIWINENELFFLDGDNRARRLNVDSGVVSEPLFEGTGMLPNPTMTHVCDMHFVHPLAENGAVRKTGNKLEGCEPTFTFDGRWSVRMSGAGGPITRIDPATSQIFPLLQKNDSRLPADRGYLYFPMPSPCRRLLAFGASPGQHDHFKSDYDIFIVAIDPETLAPLGAPVRYSFDPATDRYPAPFLTAASAATAVVPAVVKTPEPPAATDQSTWPVSPKGLVFVYSSENPTARLRSADDPALLESSLPRMQRYAIPDRNGAVELTGGVCTFAEAGQRITQAVMATGEFALEAVFRTADLQQGGPTRIVSLSRNPHQRNFTLGQERERLVMRLRTPTSGPNGVNPEVTLGTLQAGKNYHLSLSYDEKRGLIARLNGVETNYGQIYRQSLSNWEEMEFLLGDEATADRNWRGTLEAVAIYDRALSSDETARSQDYWRRSLARRPAVRRWRLETSVVDASPLPTADVAAPYREALVLVEHRIMQSQGKEAPPVGTVLRIAHWALLDGKTVPAAEKLLPDHIDWYEVEPLEAHSQARHRFISDDLELNLEALLYLEVPPSESADWR